MSIATRDRALSNLQRSNSMLPIEHADRDYLAEVLQLNEGLTELDYDTGLAEVAESLGIKIEPTADEKRNAAHHSLCESALTGASHHRTASSGSRGSASTGMTSRSSNEQLDTLDHGQTQKRFSTRRSLSFTEYEKYTVDNGTKVDAKRMFPPPIPSEPAPSLFSVSTRKSLSSIRSWSKNRFKMRRVKSTQAVISCICCRDDFKKGKTMQTLSCGHNYCETCLHVLTDQAIKDEARMPPQCCSQPIPSSTIKSVLTKDEQQLFMKSVQQFSTPWESRVFCTNPACGEFIPKRNKIDPKHPFEVVCRTCRTKACSTCKNAAHAFGQDCPADWELDAVLQMGEKSGWRRCYKCKNLVELTQGCSHITCRCKAQFCYICGAVWEPMVGCPNYCNGEEELERRRVEEEARVAEEEAAKAAKEAAERLDAEEKIAAEKRTFESDELNSLRARQINERDRFAQFERKKRWIMWTRHGQAKINILERYNELSVKMKDRHNRTFSQLEDRQVAAEMDLLSSLKQQARSVSIRLRHMEAYCDGLGRNSSTTEPARVVTEQNLRELGQQYNVRDDLERLHQSKVNVMRDKQAKQMDVLLERQGEELDKLVNRQDDELAILDDTFAKEEEEVSKMFEDRKSRLTRRWVLVEEVLRKNLEEKFGVTFAAMSLMEWPSLESRDDERLEEIAE